MTAILLTFLSSLRYQYWFLDNNFSYITMETAFLKGDLLVLCQFYSYMHAKEFIEETQAFLIQMDKRGVQWLIFVPDIPSVRKLFCNFYFYPLGSSQSGIRGLVITNYRVKR